MSIGGRRAKTSFTPPVPVPPPPPSAYGLSVPGAAQVPQQQVHQPPPPPVPVPVAPSAAVTDPSGFFGGPVAAPVPSSGYGQSAAQSPFGSYGQPAPQSQFGSYGQATTAPYVAPPGGVPAAKPRPAKALAGVAVAVVVLGLLAGPRVMDQLHRHHTTTLPAAVDVYTQLDTGTEAKISQAMQGEMPSRFKGKLTHLQASIYVQGTRPGLFVTTGDVPAGSQRHPDVAFENDDGTDDFHDVAAPASRFGGKVRCTNMPSAATTLVACGWIDDGTFGLVIVMSGDEPSTIALLGEVRAAVER